MGGDVNAPWIMFYTIGAHFHNMAHTLYQTLNPEPELDIPENN
jgi:hypothetical protein